MTAEAKRNEEKTGEPIVVCFSSDDRYAQHLGVAIASILINKAPNDRLRFYVFDGGISEENKKKLLSLKTLADFEMTFLSIDRQRFALCPLNPKLAHISIAAYYRFLMPELLVNESKVLYLDCDLIVRTSLAPLFSLDITDQYFAAVPDVDAQHSARRLGLERYCNSGVLLVHLEQWRTHRVTERLFEYAEKNASLIVQGDQDILNAELRDGIVLLDRLWNVQMLERDPFGTNGFNALLDRAKIVHFISSKKPWIAGNRQPGRELYFDYLKKTPWRRFRIGFRIREWLCPAWLFRDLPKAILLVQWGRRKKIVRLFMVTFYRWEEE